MNKKMELKMKKTVLLLMIILINLGIYSDEIVDKKELTLDVDTAVSLALANNLGLKADKMQFESKKWSMFTSWNTFVPTVNMSATTLQYNQEVLKTRSDTIKEAYEDNGYKLSDSEVYDTDEWDDVTKRSLIAKLNVSFNFHASMVFQVYQTVLDWQSGKLSLEIAKKQIELNVKKTLYNLILTEKNIVVTEESINNAEKRYNQAVINYRNGLISEYDMLSAEVAYKNMIPGLIEMKNGYEASLLSFKQMIGIKKDVVLTFAAKIESEKKKFDANEIINRYIYKNLDLSVLDYSVKNAINARNISISQLTPSFSFGYTTDPTFNNYPLNGSWFEDMDEWKQQTGAFTLSFSIPVSSFVPFSKEQMDIARGQFSINAAKFKYDDLKQKKELEIEKTIMGLDKSKESLEVLKLNVALAKRAFNKAEEAYRLGTKELLDVQNSELELNNAKLNLLKEEYNYTTGLLDLEYLINTKL